MIFRQQMIDEILAGRKTQTRRHSNRYKVGHAYGLQPGRGKLSLPDVKIEITGKRKQRLGEITTRDAVAEGFDSRARFLEYWASIHGGVEPGSWLYAYSFRLIDSTAV